MKTKIDSLKLTTADPGKLIQNLFDKIDHKKIRSWEYDCDELLSHKGGQYIDHFYFKYSIDQKKGILIFDLYSDGNQFAESRAIQLLERMLKEHFGDDSDII